MIWLIQTDKNILKSYLEDCNSKGAANSDLLHPVLSLAAPKPHNQRPMIFHVQRYARFRRMKVYLVIFAFFMLIAPSG